MKEKLQIHGMYVRYAGINGPSFTGMITMYCYLMRCQSRNFGKDIRVCNRPWERIIYGQHGVSQNESRNKSLPTWRRICRTCARVALLRCLSETASRRSGWLAGVKTRSRLRAGATTGAARPPLTPLRKY